jgi:hypothetical protein
MDDESNIEYKNRKHSGLVSYYKFRNLKSRQYENSWNDRLKELLDTRGLAAEREYRYPDSRKHCDLFLNDKKIWIETKAAWKSWYDAEKQFQNKNRYYNNYIDGSSKTHSIKDDFDKLSKLTKQNADYVGELIIGFDNIDEPMDEDITKIIDIMDLKNNGWEIFGHEIWEDRNYRKCRYNCWFIGKKVI